MVAMASRGGNISKDTISMAGVNILYNGSVLEGVTFACFIWRRHPVLLAYFYFPQFMMSTLTDDFVIVVVPVKLLEPRSIPIFVSQAWFTSSTRQNTSHSKTFIINPRYDTIHL